MKHLFTLLFFIAFCSFSIAQVATPGIAPSEKYALQADIDQHVMPSFDLNRLLLEDAMEEEKGGTPPRFGHKMDVKISPKEYGTWEELPDGGRVWRLQVTSFDAYSLNFLFSHFHMPQGAEFYLYNEDKSYRIGAFTMLNNKSDGVFATAPVKGESVTLEYYEPAYSRNKGKIQISHVVHGYKNLFKTAEQVLEKGFGDSGSCNNDVACMDSVGWENQIRSVAMVVVNGFRSCTGAIVNNTAQDGIPYFLSANHCGTGVNNTWVFVFNYDSPSCNGPDGSLAQSITGGTLKANYAPSDVTLFELSLPPPPDYIVYYSGWNKANVGATLSTGIHHPSGDVKKISWNNTPLYSGNWPGSANVPSGNHWIVDDWEDGTTEGGSSGSPIYDQNHLVVGQLHGGGAACGNSDYDSYGKFAVSWNGGGTPSTRLSNWLDPAGIGNDTLHGAYFIEPPLTYNVEALSLQGADGILCEGSVDASFVMRNIGSTDITTFNYSFSFDGNTAVNDTWTGPAVGFYQSVTVNIPTTVVGTGMHDLSVTITSINGNPDDDTSNNTVTSDFEVVDGNNLIVELLTDNFPEETSYEIQDLAGGVIYTQTGFTGDATLYTNDFCLADGCYRFVIYDDYGDGICCGQWGDGGFTLFDENGTELGFGGEFGETDTVEFCLPFTALSAQFSVDEIYCVNELVSPQDNSANATGWSWSTPGANVETHSGQTPSFSYGTIGSYTIYLTASNDMGEMQVDSNVVQVVANPNPPTQMAGPTMTQAGATETYAVPPSGGSTYTWVITGGTQISGGNSNIAGVTWDGGIPLGMICVSITNANGCTSTQFCKEVDISGLSVENIIETTGLSVYPNPTSGTVHVDMSRRAEMIQVFDIVGKESLRISHPDLQNSLELPRVEGVYFIRITFEGGAVTQRVFLGR